MARNQAELSRVGTASHRRARTTGIRLARRCALRLSVDARARALGDEGSLM